MDREVVEIFSDGACRGNPGPGGWGVLLRAKGTERELYGGEADTTNNRMELTAVIRALEALKRPVDARVYTDSEYVRRGISEWLPEWKARGWRTRQSDAVLKPETTTCPSGISTRSTSRSTSCGFGWPSRT